MDPGERVIGHGASRLVGWVGGFKGDGGEDFLVGGEVHLLCRKNISFYPKMKQVGILLGLWLVVLFPVKGELKSELVGNGFKQPVWVGAPGCCKGKLWVMEQAGTVWIVDLKTGEQLAEPFLKISDRVSRGGGEQGLLGLAFSPDYEKSGRFYVNYTKDNGDSRVERFVSKDGLTTDAGAGEVVLEYKQPFENHNGGWLGFGPDGYLYIATGDGGAADDPHNSAQDMGSLLGKLLRIDVSGEKGYVIPKDNPYQIIAGAMPEIVAIGLRNPWRCSFDKKTGDFWIGDVGQNKWEEINVVQKGELFRKNFGWRLREGDVPNPNGKIAGEKPEGNVEPVYVYAHGGGPTEGFSVTGGFVYRGKEIKELQGRYIFADYQNPRIWSFVIEDGRAVDVKDHTSELQPEKGRINLVASFGEDADGELYLVDHTWAVYRISEK